MCQVAVKKENNESEGHVHDEERGNLKGDYGNVAILLFLYLLQGLFNQFIINFHHSTLNKISTGIPLGISSAVPILLQNRGVTYAEQAIFTFAFYPFTRE